MTREHTPWLIVATAAISVTSAGGALAVARPWLEPAAPPPAAASAPVPVAPPPAPPPSRAEAPAAPAVPPACTARSFAFPPGSFVAPAGAADALAPLVAALRSHPGAVLVVDGHADPVGDEVGNVVLSKRRARSIATVLTEAGVARERIVQRAFGPYVPLNVEGGGPAVEQRRVRVWLRDGHCRQEENP